MRKKTRSMVLCFLICLFIPFSCFAGMDKERVSKILFPDIDYLLDFINKEKKKFNINKIEKIIDFVISKKPDNTFYYVKKDDDFYSSHDERSEKKPTPTSAYFDFDIKANFENIITYLYNPDFPSHVFYPSSIRVSGWQKRNGNGPDFLAFQEALKNDTFPVIVDGIEHSEITPNEDSGAYYTYNFLSTYILDKYKGKKIFITVSKQKNISDVGRRGYALNPDKVWDFLYTGEEGTTITFLTWVSAYIYESYDIVFYYETEPGKPLTRYGLFKWMHAGWGGSNMVKRDHIITGIIKVRKYLKEIFEKKSLPQPKKIAKVYSDLNSLPMEKTRSLVKTYFNNINKKYGKSDDFPKKEFIKYFSDEKFINSMKKNQLLAILFSEYMKNILGYDFILEKSLVSAPF